MQSKKIVRLFFVKKNFFGGNEMILKLKPACKNYLWGGHRLVEEYGVEYDGEILAEAWELSAHPDGASIITNGEYAGKSLRECKLFSTFVGHKHI